jgi:hypothetical protein
MTKHIRTVRITKLKVAWMLALATSTIVAGVAQSRTLSEQPNLNTLVAQVRADIHRIRQIGWRQDRSAVPELVQILEAGFKDQSDHPISRYRPRPALPWSASYLTHLQAATIVALGRIGDPRALPALDKIAALTSANLSDLGEDVVAATKVPPDHRHLDYRHLAPLAAVAAARIRAEQAVPQADTLGKWQAQVQYFVNALGVSLPELSRQIAKEKARRYPHDLPPTLARAAVRALAEMAAEAYCEGCRESFDWLKHAGVAWEADLGAWLTVELAKRTPEQRLSWLMEQMRSKTVLTPADSYLSQAIADLSDSAVPALEKWLQELWAARAVETRNPDKTYTHTDNMIEEAYWLLSATGSDAALRVLKAQYEQCRSADEEGLEALLKRVLRETPWVFVSDW